jgi:hypothetical protein
MPIHGGWCVDDAHASALELGGPRPRACSPRARQSSPEGCSALERGGPRPRGRIALERGGPRPMGHSTALPRWVVGGRQDRDRVAHVFRFVG